MKAKELREMTNEELNAKLKSLKPSFFTCNRSINKPNAIK